MSGAPRRTSHGPGSLKKAGLGLIVALCALALLELALRMFAGLAPLQSAHYQRYERALVEMGGFDDTGRLFEEDSELFWRLRPDVRGLRWQPKLWLDNRTNSFGWRDVERDQDRAPGSLRLLCIGDSCTYGTGVRLADTWPQRLEQMLASFYTDRVVEVLNFGVPGYTSDQGVTLLRRHLVTWNPDLVIVALGLNDARHWDLQHHHEHGHGLCRTDREIRAILASTPARVDRTFSRLHLYRWLRRWIPGPTAKDARSTSGEGTVRVPPNEYFENLTSMLELCREASVQLVWMVWPIRWQIEAHDGAELEPATAYQSAMRELATRTQTPLLDLVPIFTGRDIAYVDSVHMDVTGLESAAFEIGRFLKDQNLLPLRH